MLEAMIRKSQIGVLDAQLMGRMRMYEKVAQTLSGIQSKLLQDQKLRETFRKESIKPLPESLSTPYEPISLTEAEKRFHRDDEFAALVQKLRQKYASELRELRTKLCGNKLFRESFISTVRATENAVAFQDAVAALRRVNSFSKPTVPPFPDLSRETDELVALLKQT